MLGFLRRNQVLLSSFMSVFLSFYILALGARGQLKTDPLSLLLLAVMRPFQIGIQTAVVKVRELEKSYIDLWSLADENERLRAKILQLEEERNRLLEAEATNQMLRELLELQSHLPSKSATASVVSNSASTWFHSLILDKGSDDGVQKGMAVVTPLGVVGQVVAATATSAKVLLLTDPYSAVDVVDQRSRARGIVSGSPDHGAIMKYVQRNEDIQEGDRLITSGLDGVFPKGLLVGTVTKVRKKSFGLFQNVTVSLAIDPGKVEEAIVVSAEEPSPEEPKAR